MNRLALVVYLFSILSATSSVQAAGTVATEKEPVGLYQHFSPLAVAAGEFQQKKYFTVLKRPILSSGKVYFDAQQGFVWQSTVPVQAALLLKKDKFYSREDGGQLQEIKHGGALSSVLLSAMSGNLEALETAFSLVLTSSNCLQLKAKSVAMAKVIAWIELCGAGHLERISLMEVSGNSTEITLQLTELERLPEGISAQLQ